MMLYLLTETSIYLPLPNDCYCQLTGPPLIYSSRFVQGRMVNEDLATKVAEAAHATKRKMQDFEKATRPKKRQRRRMSECEVQAEPRRREPDSAKMYVSAFLHSLSPDEAYHSARTPADIRICRSSMFYGRPCKSSTGRISLGLSYRRKCAFVKSIEWC